MQWPKNCSSFNLIFSLYVTIAVQSRFVKIMVLTVLDQFTIIDIQLGPNLSNEQILGHCILEWKPEIYI